MGKSLGGWGGRNMKIMELGFLKSQFCEEKQLSGILNS
jgi:hypothetical protein